MHAAPHMPIHEALSRSRAVTDDDVLTYEADGIVYAAYRDDLLKMDGMGLGELPLDCIAIPQTSPLIRGERCGLTATQDYARRLSSYFPIYFVAALYELQSLINRFGVKSYVIGGITRDLLLMSERRLEVEDVDITVEGDGLALADFLAENSRNFEVTDRFPEFGTAKLQYKDCLGFDVASTRKEIYPHCGALPVVVERGVPLVQDVIRRDFTINALALAIHDLGQVIDYSNGIRDIEDKVIRVLHPVSFFEDPSRILRALKFSARFDFPLADETRCLLDHFLRCMPATYKGGGERIKQELKGFLSVEETPAKSERIAFFMSHGCFRLLNAELTQTPPETEVEAVRRAGPLVAELKEKFAGYTDRDFRFDLYLCLLLRDLPEEVFQKTSQRLGLTKYERENIERYRELRSQVRDRFGTLHEFSSPVEIYDLFHGLPFITVCASLVDLGLADPGLFKHAQEAFLKYKRKWEKLQLELDGNDLIELGVPVGKEVGRLLDEMLHAKLAGRLPDRLDEVRYVQEVLNPTPEGSGDAVPPGA